MSEDATKEELYEKAQELDIEGRSTMDKDELAKAVAEAESTPEAQPAAEPVAEQAPVEQSQAGGFQPVEDNSTTHDTSGGEFLPEPGPEAHNQSEIKSRAEEEAEQHERRKAGDAEVEKTQADAETTPF
jgi:hypothetical protein